MAQVTANSTVHDVVVVGSGAGGGTVTKVLADLGVSVLLLEAGPMLNMADLKEHMWPYNVPHRGAGRARAGLHRRPTGFTYSATYGGAQLEGEPYTVAPGSDFSWFRSRILGGRTNHYGRVTLRLADYDFKPQIDRRPRLRLADQLRGHRAVLRQGRAIHRRHRHASRASAARPTASSIRPAPLARTTCSCSGVREARHPRRAGAAGGHDRRRATAGRRATTAASAAAAA